MEDLNAVLTIQPDFSAALIQRGKIYVWQGDFSKAITDLKQAGHQNDFVRPTESINIQINTVREAESAIKEAKHAEKKHDYRKCVDFATTGLRISPGLASLWQLRSNCAVGLGDVEGAVSDLTYAPPRRRLMTDKRRN